MTFVALMKCILCLLGFAYVVCMVRIAREHGRINREINQLRGRG